MFIGSVRQMKFLEYEYRFQIKLHRFAYRNARVLKSWCLDLELFTAICALIWWLTELDLFKYITIAGSFAVIVIEVLLNINNVLTSLKKFVVYGCIISFILSLCLSIILMDLFCSSDQNAIVSIVIEFMCWFFSLLIIWLFFSLIANNSVAKITNLILATFTGIITIIESTVLSFFPDNMFSDDWMPSILMQIGYSNKQCIEIVTNLLLAPFLITNLIAVLVCEIKGYWIEKYNDGKDITMEEIKKIG